jgi:hypothetical protein
VDFSEDRVIPFEFASEFLELEAVEVSKCRIRGSTMRTKRKKITSFKGAPTVINIKKRTKISVNKFYNLLPPQAPLVID